MFLNDIPGFPVFVKIGEPSNGKKKKNLEPPREEEIEHESDKNKKIILFVVRIQNKFMSDEHTTTVHEHEPHAMRL